jgi:hypothetical protein
MAWLDVFRFLKQNEGSFDSVLLSGSMQLVADRQRLLPSLIERASGVLASNLSSHLAKGEKNRLIFVLPNATQSLGRFLAVSLLLADFVKRNAGQNAVIGGDLLLVTQQIRNCVNLLRDVGVSHRSQKLAITEFWPIEVLSQYAPPADSKPRVFVANPGWSSMLGQRQAFGSVVIDASHPRTSNHLEALLKQPSIAFAPKQILVIPPWEHDRIEALSEPNRPSDLIWAWDPAAVEAIEELLGGKSLLPPKKSERVIWLSSDAEVEDQLIELHSLLVGAMKAGKGFVPRGVLGAWATYHRLRQLSVPLIALEEERRGAYQTLTIKERIRELEDEPPEARGAVGTYLDTNWPRVISAFKDLYEILLHRKEPAKFYTLASIVEEFLESRTASDRLRIVAPTAHEGNMIVSLLGEIVSNWPDALQTGAVSLTTIKEEPRLIAEGSVQQTVLLGFRASETRYLDVYPGIPVHLVAYPYEAEVDDKIQRRIHASIESLQENGPRTIVLKQLRLDTGLTSQSDPFQNPGGPKSKRPETHRRFEMQPRPQQRRFLDDEVVEPLNLQKMIGPNWFDEIHVSRANQTSGNRDQRSLEYCEISDTLGDQYRFPVSQLVDVFRQATEQKERLPAGELEPGMVIVVLVDDPYEDIFQRLLEAIHEQQDIGARMALALWQHAKAAVLTKYSGNRMKLHRSLEANGLSVDYGAVVGWYRSGEDEIIAPLRRQDFEIVARASGLYSDVTRIDATFNCIQHERVSRRTWGRKLGRLLSHLAAGQHYEVALESADAIGSALEQIAAAVTLREVDSVRKPGS